MGTESLSDCSQGLWGSTMAWYLPSQSIQWSFRCMLFGRRKYFCFSCPFYVYPVTIVISLHLYCHTKSSNYPWIFHSLRGITSNCDVISVYSQNCGIFIEPVEHHMFDLTLFEANSSECMHQIFMPLMSWLSEAIYGSPQVDHLVFLTRCFKTFRLLDIYVLLQDSIEVHHVHISLFHFPVIHNCNCLYDSYSS